MNEPLPPRDPDDAKDASALENLLAGGLTPIAPAPERAAQMRARLLDRARRSRTADQRFITVHREEGDWRPLTRGVRAKMLCQGKRSRSVLVELEPGAALPTHRHHDHEECIVLSGEAQLGDLNVRAGDYHLAPAGSRHGRVSSRSGALLYLRGTSIGRGVDVARDLLGAWLPGAGDAPLTVRAQEGIWEDYAPGVKAKALWKDGERESLLLRLEPGARVAGHPHPCDEECLMLEGEAFFGDTLLRPGEYQLAPAGSQHRDVTSDVGALLFVHGAARPPLAARP
jgi:quercetin dioxygenase-like cupin family protein